MTEIKYAITNFEEFLEADIGQGDLHVCSAETALAILREQAEREKGCKYCSPNPYGHGEAVKSLIHQAYNDKAQIDINISGRSLHALAIPSPKDTNLAKRYSGCQRINYCPMCGKRLEVNQDG